MKTSNDMNYLKNARLDAISIEKNGEALRLEYSESDQGGTRLAYRFRIFQDQNTEVESGYIHDFNFSTKKTPIREIPHKVIKDAEDWINQQLKQVPGNIHLKKVLSEFSNLINKIKIKT